MGGISKKWNDHKIVKKKIKNRDLGGVGGDVSSNYTKKRKIGASLCDTSSNQQQSKRRQNFSKN
jgi:hypothetical protein